MGIYISIPPVVRQFIDQSMTDMLGTDVFGVNCVLSMPPSPTYCANCVADPIGMKSSNIYITGGPQPFEDGQVCPVCHGDYILQVEQTKTIVMVIEWKPERFLDIMRRTVRFPQSTIQSRGFVSDLQYVQNCSHMETFLDTSTDHYTFKLRGEPIVPGRLSRKFFYALWERV
jgi:hypothetical protein